MRTKQLSPIELTREMLDRIERLNPSLGAYYTVFGDQALAEARAAESEIAGGTWRGPLHGVPIAFKDLYELGPTTAGSKLLAGHVARREADLVTRARAEGAVILGKLATHEFGLAAATLADHFPPARNPWDPDRTPGGSTTRGRSPAPSPTPRPWGRCPSNVMAARAACASACRATSGIPAITRCVS